MGIPDKNVRGGRREREVAEGEGALYVGGMANPTVLARLKEGRAACEEWVSLSYLVDRGGVERMEPDLRGADLTGAHLPEFNLSDALLQSAKLTRADLREANLSRAELVGAECSGATFTWADFTAANLERAVLTGANLFGVMLRGAQLTGAQLQGAYLRDANLQYARLGGADLRGADLGWARFDQTRLQDHEAGGADFTGAKLEETMFVNVDLSRVKGLESCVHTGPSFLDPRTLARSGALPRAFLRGCGLPDRLVEHGVREAGQEIPLFACRIHWYSAGDEEFAARLCNDLQENGVRVWLERHEPGGGGVRHTLIYGPDGVDVRPVMIFSEESMNGWMYEKIEPVVNRVRTGVSPDAVPEPRACLLSLAGAEAMREWMLLDEEWEMDARNALRRSYVADFAGWRDAGVYRRALEGLVRDLKAE